MLLALIVLCDASDTIPLMTVDQRAHCYGLGGGGGGEGDVRGRSIVCYITDCVKG